MDWQYAVVDFTENASPAQIGIKLDAMGVCGWELVAVLGLPHDDRYIFKRAK
jgi:hypothetical protein